MAAAVAFYLWWEVAHRGMYQYATAIYPIDDADEWRYTACSRLVEHGYQLFSQVFSAQPPLLFLSLSWSMRLFGDSISGARWAEVAFGVLALLCSAWMSWLLAGPVAGGATALLLAISPGFLVYFHTIEAEGPMMALATLGLALALTYARTGIKPLAALAGLALAAGILIKLFALWALVPALWLVLTRRDERARTVTSAVVVLLCAIGPVALDFALIRPAEQWDQVVRMHQRAAALDLPNTIPPAKLLGQFLSLDLGLTLLAASGLVALLVLRRWREATFLIFWLLGGLVMLFLFRPLFPHHPAILLTALGCAAGTGIGLSVDSLRSRRSSVLLPATLGLLAYIVLVPRVIHDDRHVVVAGLRPEVDPLAAYVRSHSGASDFVATDDLAVADRAHRLVPPPLCDPSNVRLRAGYLTASDLIGSTERYRAKLALPSFGIYEQVPAYLGWLEKHYRREAAPYAKRAYVAR